MQQTKPKVSVVVPIYNTEQYLEKCVKSIVGGTLQDVEIILVNDGSKGNAKQMCENFANNDNRIKVLNKKNEGLRAAVFDGIKMAQGEYIGFVDSDDYVEPGMFEVLYQKAQQHRADIVQCGFHEVFDQREKIIRRSFFSDNEIVYENDIESEILQPYFEDCATLSPLENCRWNKLFESKMLKSAIENLPKEITMGEDLTLILSALPLCKKVIVLKQEVNYCYRFVENSMSKNFNEKLIVETLKMLDEIKRIASEQKRQGKSLEIERNRHIAMLIHFCIESKYSQKQKLETIKRLKKMLSEKQYLWEFSKKQPLMGKISYVLIYLGLERLVLMLKR